MMLLVPSQNASPSFGERARLVLDETFESAFRKAPFHFLCTLLRVEAAGVKDWDPLRESHEALQQYANEIRARPGASSFTAPEDRRMALLIYCHLTEIAAVYQVLANLLRCAKGFPYLLDPFADLVKAEVRKEARRAPTPAQKMVLLRELESSPRALSTLMEEFFDGSLRDAFYRSEYVLLADSLRYRAPTGEIESLAWKEIEERIRHATAFYNAFFGGHHAWLRALGDFSDPQKLSSGQLTLETDSQGALEGFEWKRADGSVTSFSRSNGIVEAKGVSFTSRGELARTPTWTPT